MNRNSHSNLSFVYAYCLILIVFSLEANAQQFTCDPEFYQILSADLQTFRVSDGQYVDLPGSAIEPINATGYNRNDDFIYGVGTTPGSGTSGQTGTGDLYRIDQDGNATSIAAVGVLSIAGDMDSNDHLWVRGGGGQGRNFRKILVNPPFTVITESFSGPALSGAMASPNENIADIVYIAGSELGTTGDYVFGMSNTGNLIVWDIANATVERKSVTGFNYGVGSAASGSSYVPGSSTFGAGWTDLNGNLFVSNNGSAGASPSQAAVWQITDVLGTNPQAIWVVDSQITTANDGAGCPLAPPPFTAPTDCSQPSAITGLSNGSINTGQNVSYVISGGTPGTLSWSVSPTTGVTPNSGTGASTGNITFANTGAYTLTYTSTNNADPSGCNSIETSTAMATISVTAPGPSGDTDGVDPIIEDAAPNAGDGNDDGILDSLQDNVASLPDTSGNGTYVTIEVTSSECAEITSVTALSESSIQDDSGYFYPLGLIDFTASCTTIGHTMDVTLYWHGLGNIDFYRRFGETFPGAGDATYRNFQVERGQVLIDGNMVATASFSLTDGQSGDENVLQRTIKSVTGPSTADFDNDMQPDETDLDDDNDGILDTDECSGVPTNWNIASNLASSGSLLNVATISDGSNTANISVLSTSATLSTNSSANLINFQEQTSQTISIVSDERLIDIDLFVQGIYAIPVATTFIGDFQVEFWDGTMVNDVPFQTLAVTNGFPTEAQSTETPLGTQTVSGSSYAMDATTNGINNQAYGVIGFPSLNTSIFNTSGVRSISFSVLAGGPTDISGLGFTAAIARDTDNDDILDCFDIDSDNDGCTDALEGSGARDFQVTDLSNNGAINTLLYPIDGFGVPDNGNNQDVGSSRDDTIIIGCCNLQAPMISAF